MSDINKHTNQDILNRQKGYLKQAQDRLKQIPREREGWVVVADVVDQDIIKEKMVYSVSKKEDTGFADVNLFSNMKHYVFFYKADAAHIVKTFTTKNAYGPIKWYVVSEHDYLQHIIIELQKSVDLWNQIIESERLNKKDQ